MDMRTRILNTSSTLQSPVKGADVNLTAQYQSMVAKLLYPTSIIVGGRLGSESNARLVERSPRKRRALAVSSNVAVEPVLYRDMSPSDAASAVYDP
jgi:hypothetical protein